MNTTPHTISQLQREAATEYSARLAAEGLSPYTSEALSRIAHEVVEDVVPEAKSEQNIQILLLLALYNPDYACDPLTIEMPQIQAIDLIRENVRQGILTYLKGIQEEIAPIDWSGLEAFRASLPKYQQQEVFRFFAAKWDVVRARYIIAQRPHIQGTANVLSQIRLYGFDQEPVLTIQPGSSDQILVSDTTTINHTFALACDLERPLIITQIEVNGSTDMLAIDGLHRIYRAAREGLHVLPAYRLTVQESNLVRIR